MLRVIQQSSAAAGKSYYAAADYYTSDRDESAGHWGGEGARRLGLDGVVEKAAFDRLCDNLDPRTGLPLTARTQADRTVGYDFTFSVPKSVSLLYGLTEDAEIRDAFRAAVVKTMRDVEAEMKTRVRRGGRDQDRTTGNAVWAEFVHTTSRPVNGVPDPQLHAHCFVFNATYDVSERRWKAGQFRDLKRDAPYFQAAFRVRLADKLQDLGYGIDRKRDDFELAGVPRSVLARFSRRTAIIEAKAAELGITDAKAKDPLGATTRERKNSRLERDELRQEWRQRLKGDECKALEQVHARASVALRSVEGEREAVDYALAHGFSRAAVVEERKLVTEALKRGLGSVTVDGVKQEFARRPFIVGSESDRRTVTTPEVLAEERKLVAFARAGRGKCRPIAAPDRPITRKWLNEGQRAAVRHVLGSRDRVTLVRGAAGTGKTTLEQELGDAIREAGIPVVAIAPSAAASRGVLREEAKFERADTVAKFMASREMQAGVRGGVILLDEASLIGSTDALALCETVRGLDARLVVVGDRKQHRAVSRGQPLKLWEEEAGLPVAEVADILRQRGAYKEATQALSEGNVEKGLATLDRLGWVREVRDTDRNRELAGAYLDAVREQNSDGTAKTALIVSPTHAEADTVTAAVRSQLKDDGLLGEEREFAAWRPAHLTAAEKTDPTVYEPGDLLRFHRSAPGHRSGSKLVVAAGTDIPCSSADRFEVYRPTTLRFAVGDRLRVTAGGTTRDGKHRLDNGSLHTLTAFDKKGNLVLENGWIIDKEFGHFAHGYVVTSHASQGRTVDRVFVAQSAASFGASNTRQFYVSVSRGKERAEVFTDDKYALRQAVLRPDEPMTATALARQHGSGFRGRLKNHLGRLRRAAVAWWGSERAEVVPEQSRDRFREAEYAR